MNTDQPVNRVEAELAQWRQKEERFGRMFAFRATDDPVFLKEKIRHYDAIAAKFRNSADPDERLALRILRQERNRVEKRLYPNVWLRLLRRLAVEPLLQRGAARRQARQAARDERELREAVVRAGFGQAADKAGQGVRRGADGFTVPLSHYVNESERIDYQLLFARDRDGRYRLEGYRATLGREGEQGAGKSQDFRADGGEAVTPQEAYNLLSGRAVRTEASVREDGKGRWTQLDLNDRDAAGNHRVKEFHPGYGFDLGQALKGLPLAEGKNPEALEKLTAALAVGDRHPVTVERDGRAQTYHIEANPQMRTVNVYDADMRKVGVASLTEKKANQAAENSLKTERHAGKERKNGMRA